MSQTLSQSALAKGLNLSKQMVSKLKKQGMPIDSVEAARAWREQNLNIAQRKDVMIQTEASAVASDAFEPPTVISLKVFGASPVLPPADAAFGDGEQEDEETESFKAAKTRLTIAEANLKELAEARERHELIRVDAVKRQFAVEYSTLREALMQIPARLAPLVAAETDAVAIRNLMEQEVHQALVRLSGAAEQVEAIPGAFD